MQCTYINKFGIRCEEESFKGLKECVLHCTEREIHNDGYENYRKAFYDFLSEHIFEEVDKNFQNFWKTSDLQTIAEQESQRNDRNEFLRLIGGVKETELSSNLKEYMRKTDLILDEIKFPKDIAMQGLSPNAILILKNLGRVTFKGCEFNSPSTMLFAEFYYEHCIFKGGARITPFPDLKDDHKYRYMYCRFQSDVEVMSSTHSKEINSNLFYECLFFKKVSLLDVNINKSVFHFPKINKDLVAGERGRSFSDFKDYYLIKELLVKDCFFKLSFKLNGFNEDDAKNLEEWGHDLEKTDLVFSSINIISSKFESKFEVKNRVIKYFKFENSNIKGIFDIFNSRIMKAKFLKCIFYDFAGFEEVEFGVTEEEVSNIVLNSNEKESDIKKNYLTVFKYATFMDFSSFRGTRFSSGLDFSKTNLKDTPNFLNVYVDPKNTNRETFRIIKNSFDDAGNKIEANRFFVKEMNAYQRELIKTRDKEVGYIKNLKNSGKNNEVRLYKSSKGYKSSQRARWVFNINSFTSEFGGNYMRPISLLIFSAIVYTAITLWHKHYFKKHPYFTSWDWLNNAQWSQWYFESHEYFMSWKWFDIISKPFNEFAINI